MRKRRSFSRSKSQSNGSRFGNQSTRADKNRFEQKSRENKNHNMLVQSTRSGGRKQATFDPTHFILSLKVETRKDFQQESHQIQHSFNDFEISNDLKVNITKRGYTSPTPIQDKIIPHIIEGKDVVGIANTGTGKTASFLIPLLDKVLADQNQKVLIIAPTRELAVQIRAELFEFSKGLPVRSTLLIGGSSLNRQIESLRRGQNFVIGTPGRIKDLNQQGKLPFNQFNNIVLDEVDRMLDMGFIHDIKAIIDALPNERQSLFFSATVTDKIKEIMNGFLINPVHVSVKTQDTSLNVKQDIVKLAGRPKIDVLRELLVLEEFQKVLVFGRTKRGAEKLSKVLQSKGFKANAIHGNKSQSQRQRALQQFKDDYVQVLIATDVIARGLDIENVTHVINYDLPESYENYIHRIGRTGRADNQGVALTFVE